QCTDRSSANDIRLYSTFFKRLYDAYVRPATRSSSAQGQADRSALTRPQDRLQLATQHHEPCAQEPMIPALLIRAGLNATITVDDETIRLSTKDREANVAENGSIAALF